MGTQVQQSSQAFRNIWEYTCRICSSPGEYEVFAVIPSYLHASHNEFLHWNKTIDQLLEDTTGLLIDPNDGLPKKICALCVSYLKHAATFRQQVIDNTLNLKAAIAYKSRTIPAQISAKEEADRIRDKEAILVTASDLIYNDKRKTDLNSLVSNVLRNQAKNATPASNYKNEEYMKKFLVLNNDASLGMQGEKCNANNRRNTCVDSLNNADAADANRTENGEALKTYLNLLFDKDTNARSPRKYRRGSQSRHNVEVETLGSDLVGDEFQTASSDDNEACEQKQDFFNYKEKNFEEDDVMDLVELKAANIIVNIPETCKERKCRACFRRFMFEDSYKEHMTVCIEYKFLLLIEEINRLLDIRRSKAISPHEFIRRMIFSLRKTCQWLKTSCGEILLPDLLVNGDGKKRLESDGKSSAAEVSSGCKSDENGKEKIDDVFVATDSQNSTIVGSNSASESKNNSLLDILKQKADPSLIRFITKTPDPLLARLKFSAEANFATSTPENDAALRDKLEENLRLCREKNQEWEHRVENMHIQTEDEIRIAAAVKMLNKPKAANLHLHMEETAESGFKRITTSEEDDERPGKHCARDLFTADQRKTPNGTSLKTDEENFLRDLFSIQTTTKSLDEAANREIFFEKLCQAGDTPPMATKQHTSAQLLAPLFQKVSGGNVAKSVQPTYSKISFSARCNTCSMAFESIGTLEEHNAKFHNNFTKVEHHKKIIALFEEGGPNDMNPEKKFQKLDGIVDILNI